MVRQCVTTTRAALRASQWRLWITTMRWGTSRAAKGRGPVWPKTASAWRTPPRNAALTCGNAVLRRDSNPRRRLESWARNTL